MKKDDFYLVDLEFLNLLFKGTIHFECDSNNFLSLLLNPWTNGVGLLSELESEMMKLSHVTVSRDMYLS